MANILLDYFFPITTINPTPAASTAFLKQVCIVVKPASGVTTGVITPCVTMAAVEALTDNLEAQQLFNAGMSKVFVLPSDDLEINAALEGYDNSFFTILISSDFSDADVVASKAALTINGDLVFTAVSEGFDGNDITVTLADTETAGAESVTVTGKDIVIGIEAAVSTADQIKTAFDASAAAVALATCAVVSGQGSEAQAAAAEANLAGGDGLTLGAFKGVVGVQSTDDTYLKAQGAIANRCAFHTTSGNKAKNMFYAFGKLLSNALAWRNQQYIEMPLADDVDTIGEANTLFDDRISFVVSDDQYSNRLALFAAGGKAIIAPYIKRNIELDLQSAALSYVSGNQPEYTLKHAALLEDELQKVIQEKYIDTGFIEAGTASVSLAQDNFVASGEFNISEPNALWKLLGEMRQTL